MARKQLVSLIDDLDGTDGEETVEFGINGVQYQIDLSSRNAEVLRDALALFVSHARRSGGRKRSILVPGTEKPVARGTAVVDREQNQAIRTWANNNGFTVSKRGRIPGSVAAAFHAMKRR